MTLTFDPFSPERLEAIGALMVPLSAHAKTQKMTVAEKGEMVAELLQSDPELALRQAAKAMRDYDRRSARIFIYAEENIFVRDGFGGYAEFATLLEAWRSARLIDPRVRPRLEHMASPKGRLP